MPQRTCAACRNKGDANNFFRMVVGPGGKIACELGSELPGRGAHCCFDMGCISGMTRSNRLEIALKKRNLGIDTDELTRDLRMLLGQSLRGMLLASRGKGVLALGREAAFRRMKFSGTGKAFVSRDMSSGSLASLKRASGEFYILPFDMKELGRLFRRRPVGALFVEDPLLAEGIRRRAAQEKAISAG